ncbi:Chitin synthase, class 2, partial [Kappamyces sp. JEL0680]
NILDKPLESVCGYISVLPGAFSAYRFAALRGRPLAQYFKGESPAADIFTSNLYLAEDRILCFELVTKSTEPWLLKYVKNAKAETDVPATLDELTSQRRRWLNGSFFASVYALANFTRIYSSPHSAAQKALFTLEFVYNAVNVWFTWFSIGNFYLSFYFLFNVRKGPGREEDASLRGIDPFFPYGDLVFQTLQGLYLFGLFAMVITALGNRPRGTRWLYRTICIFFACIMGLMIFMAAWSVRIQVILFTQKNIGAPVSQMWIYLVKTPEFRDMVIATCSTYLLYILASLLALDPWHVLTCMVQYLVLFPTFINVFMVYSFCNLHDVTWGTKGATKEAEPVGAAAKVVKEDGTAEFEYLSVLPEDIAQEWSQCLLKFTRDFASAEKTSDKRDEKIKKEDACKSFRTRIVLFWFSCNAFLVLLFTNTASLEYFFPRTSTAQNPYLTFLFWSFAGLAFVRFVGSCFYLVGNWKERMVDLRQSNARV